MNTDLGKFSHEWDIEASAVKIIVNHVNICIRSIYRAPSGNFAHFLDKLEGILNLLQRNDTQLIICGDININYLVENNKKNSSGFFIGFLHFHWYCLLSSQNPE
jgi:exonuclease III